MRARRYEGGCAGQCRSAIQAASVGSPKANRWRDARRRDGLRLGIGGPSCLLPDMADTTSSPARVPWHVWTVGAVSLLWNSAGAVDFALTQVKSEAYLNQFTPEQLAYFHSFPAWVVVAWGVATWGSLLGSLLLLLRRRLAVPVNGAVLAGMAATFFHNFVLTDGLKLMGSAAGLVFTGVIVLVAILLFFYARAMARRGVLR